MKKFLPILFAICATFCACNQNEPEYKAGMFYIPSFTIVQASESEASYEVKITGTNKNGVQVISSPVYKVNNIDGGDLPYTYTLSPALFLGNMTTMAYMDYLSVTLTKVLYSSSGTKYSRTVIDNKKIPIIMTDWKETYTVTDINNEYTLSIRMIMQ